MGTLMTITLKTIPDIYEFVDLMNSYDGTVKVCSESFCVNGKSLLGLFSLDLLNPLLVNFSGEVTQEMRDILWKWAV